MNCVDVSENMISAVDDRLNGHDRIYFYDHIERCIACKNQYIAQMMVKSALKEKTTRKEVPQELLNFVRLVPNHPDLKLIPNHSFDPKSCEQIHQSKFNILVWILVISAVFSLSAFYIINLK